MMKLSRRKFLQRTGVLGCSVAASPLFTPMSFAALPSDNRLVVIILRGGMDGLDVVRRFGPKANWRSHMRCPPPIATSAAILTGRIC